MPPKMRVLIRFRIVLSRGNRNYDTKYATYIFETSTEPVVGLKIHMACRLYSLQVGDNLLLKIISISVIIQFWT